MVIEKGEIMFQPLFMGTNHMLGQDSWVPITTNNFEIRIYDNDATASSYDYLTLTTDQIGQIQEQEDDIVVHYANGVIRFPSKVTYSDVDWTLNCYCEPDTVSKLKEWRDLVYNPKTELMGLPSQYMKNVYFIRYDGQGNVRQALKAPGCWPKGLSYGEYNQTGGSLVQISTTLVISKAIYMSQDELS